MPRSTTWAISTNTRNIESESAVDNVIKASEKLKEELKIENFYKKIDSTLRGHVGLEIVAMLEDLRFVPLIPHPTLHSFYILADNTYY